MTVFRSHHVNGVGARIDNESTKPIKIAIIVAYNKTTLCTLWVSIEYKLFSNLGICALLCIYFALCSISKIYMCRIIMCM